MELLKVFKPISSHRQWIIFRKNSSASSKRERLQPWLEWQKTSEGREKPKSRVVDRLNKFSEKERMCFIRNSWAFIKAPLILSCKTSSARPSIALLHSRLIARQSSKLKPLTSSSTRLSPRKTNPRFSSKTLSPLSLFRTCRENKCKSKFNSRKRNSWRQRRKPSRRLWVTLVKN